MKGAGTLAVLVGLALVAGIVLAVLKPRGGSGEEDPDAATDPQRSVEEVLGLPFLESPSIEPVSQEVLLAAIEDNLDAQFGPGGLMRRTRALELLGFSDLAERSLRDSMVAWQAGGVRGWFDTRNGRILVPGNFDENQISDRVVLHGLLARLLVHQHAPTVIGKRADDEWIAHHSVHAAIAESVMAKLRAENRAAFDIPTATQTEREAVILALPLYLHQIANLPLEKGEARIHFETRMRTGARALADLVADPPRSTLEILGGDPTFVTPVRLPAPPAGAQVQLEESLGAFPLQALLEWIDDYEQAQALAPLWRGDRYRLFATATGDHLLWVCHWETEAAAKRAAEILGRKKPTDGKRHFTVTAEGKKTHLLNCADEETARVLRSALATNNDN